MTIAKVDVSNAQGIGIYQATLGETGLTTAEVSTAEVRRILADGSAIVLDTRKPSEFAAGHLPGACNVQSKDDVPAAENVAAVERAVGAQRDRALVLYCNGPFCKGTRRLAGQLVEAGFTNVRRYQLGIPVWRALGGPTEIELEGITRIYGVDRTALLFDARTAEAFAKSSIPGTHNVPAVRVAAEGIHFAPLPRNDFITRIIIFGHDGAEARAVADALSQSPFHNVTYYSGSFAAVAAALAPRVATP
jgi:rhodanese-related sulfurtransferase